MHANFIPNDSARSGWQMAADGHSNRTSWALHCTCGISGGVACRPPTLIHRKSRPGRTNPCRRAHQGIATPGHPWNAKGTSTFIRGSYGARGRSEARIMQMRGINHFSSQRNNGSTKRSTCYLRATTLNKRRSSRRFSKLRKL